MMTPRVLRHADLPGKGTHLGRLPALFLFAAITATLGTTHGAGLARASGPVAMAPPPSQQVTFSYEARTRASHLDPAGLLIGGGPGAQPTAGTGSDSQSPPSVILSLATNLDITAVYELNPSESSVAGAIDADLRLA